jgi:hypothetical protein
MIMLAGNDFLQAIAAYEYEFKNEEWCSKIIR